MDVNKRFRRPQTKIWKQQAHAVEAAALNGAFDRKSTIAVASERVGARCEQALQNRSASARSRPVYRRLPIQMHVGHDAVDPTTKLKTTGLVLLLLLLSLLLLLL